MKIAIVGSGRIGGALGQIWAQCGHDVTFSYSRQKRKLCRLAEDAKASFGPVREAVEQADVVLLAVHWQRIEHALELAGDLADKIILNCCVPLDAGDENLVLGPTLSGAEWLRDARPAGRWVAAFNTSPSESLKPVYDRQKSELHPQMIYYGEDADAKRVAYGLIQEVGFEPLDLGGLQNGRFVEPFAMVTAVLAYGTAGGAALTYRFEKLKN